MASSPQWALRAQVLTGDAVLNHVIGQSGKILIAVAAVAALALGFTACQRTGKVVKAGEKTPVAQPADPAWANLITAHTTGAISRKSSIRVVFAADVVAADKVGSDASGHLSLEPKVQGSATFVSTREIVLLPKQEFAPATAYLARVIGQGLAGVPERLAPFEFVVQTLAPNFEVVVDGLDVGATRAQMQLSGTIATADVEDPAKLEKVLTAAFAGKALPITWLHASEARRHSFTIAPIERPMEAAKLTLKWDGAPIAVKNQGEREVEIPARDQFVVTQAQALEESNRRTVIVQFSDNLDPSQNLKGLVTLANVEFTTRVEGNTLSLYPEGELTGDVALTLEPGIKNEVGDKLVDGANFSLTFTSTKPQVRFVGTGVILPDAETLTVPFEAVSVRAVQVTALRVFEQNVPQFLQVNRLDGTMELGRVGRFLWRKTIPLTAPVAGRWTRYQLDVTELVRSNPGGLFQLTLSIAPQDATYECPGRSVGTTDTPDESPALKDQEDGDTIEPSNWDYAEDYFGEGMEVDWSQRGDPCTPAYYRYAQGIRASRNLLASNIGLIAKRDARGNWLVAATNLRTAQALSGTKISALNFQGETIGSATTSADGTVQLGLKSQPFTLIAENGDGKGYLKVNAGAALPVSHFDAGGETLARGLKGYLYGDRGVWRPGDPIYLTFVVQDNAKTLPANHPVTLELRNPRGQVAQTITNTTPVGSFYAFELQTAPDALTGDWTARATLGGATFSKTLKIETVMPNRLKVDLSFADERIGGGKPLRGKVAAQWLSGAAAAGLKSDIQMRLSPTATKFTRASDFTFDDPSRSFSGEPVTVFEGELDANGAAAFDSALQLPKDAPGMLNASFATRVFERGGAFSINRETRPLAPFARFVGLKMPKGDAARDMLLTDTQHVVELATLDADGKPASVGEVEVTLQKIEWRWWWDQSGDSSLAQYSQGESRTVIQRDVVSTQNGKGAWKFQVKHPDWGRFLVRACDKQGGHCTGKVFYIDWPSWAGRAQDQGGPAANILTVTADKEEYRVGDSATIQVPEAAQGRALLTLETGSEVLEHRWIEPREKLNRISIPITGRMAPNVYVSVTMIQPHEQKGSDRPIRLYGVVPLKVTDPQTKLAPAVTTADQWAPQSKAKVQVSETSGRAMTYTLAVVDEGLLGLTNFKTPDLYNEFYKREALGIATWDLFDEVAGAYGAELERLLALGGSDAASPIDPNANKSRFPPVVRFLGPFALKAGEKRAHEVELPQYVGAVRVMLVAGDGSAYGSAEKSVFVRQPLMVLPTLPRVIGPEESFSLPVSVFVSDAAIKNVTLKVETDALVAPVGAGSTTVAFARPEEKLGSLRLRSGARLGRSRIRVTATSGKFSATSDTYLEVRSPNPVTTVVQRGTIEPGASWTQPIKWHGLAGTNNAMLEVSAIPPMNLDGRLDYLIHYPHGCLEQITSAAFPQMYLPVLTSLDPERRASVQRNVSAAIDRLRGFQQPNGGFIYWPGGWATNADLAWRDDWSTSYAGHFLVEAAKQGYRVPADMLSGWVAYQKATAQRWSSTDARALAARSAGLAEAARLAQAYRLYTLALHGKAEVGAMNRMRESPSLSSVERWLLAASYKLAGLQDAATALMRGEKISVASSSAAEFTFGSDLRDRAILLNALVLLGRQQEASALVDEVSASLVADRWYSTQSVAYALMAMATYAGGKPFEAFSYERTVGGKASAQASSTVIAAETLPVSGNAAAPLVVKNTSDRKLYATLIVRGVPPSGVEDAAAANLSLDLNYLDASGSPVSIGSVPQGSDLITRVVVTNTSKRRIDNLALTQMVPAGWEIRNERLEGDSSVGDRSGGTTQRLGWIPDGSPDATRARAEYVDIRDDRINQYFSLKAGESITFVTRVNAAYLGRFYLPSTSVEAMYDARQFARSEGQWVEVVAAEPNR
jgi:hypothetical protein